MLDQAWSTIATFVPKFALFLVILLVGWFVARAIARIADVLLRRVGFETAVQKSGLGRTLQNSKYDGTQLMCKVIYYLLLLVVLQFAFGIFGTNPISNVLDSIVGWLPKALVAIAIIVVVGMIANAVRDILNSALSAVSAGKLLATIVWAFIMGLGVIAALNQIGVAGFVTSSVLTAVLATIAGILIVGLGGGLIKPMQSRWDRWINRVEEETQQASVPKARRAHEAETRASEPSASMSGARPGQPMDTGQQQMSQPMNPPSNQPMNRPMGPPMDPPSNPM